MNRHKSEYILIQRILCNNVFFTTHVKTIIFRREAKFENFVRGFMARQKLIHLFWAKPSVMWDQIGTSLVRFPEP